MGNELATYKSVSLINPDVADEVRKENAQATPAATPKAASEKTADNVVQFPQPKESGGDSGAQAALKAIGNLEKQRADYVPPKLNLPEKPKSFQGDAQLWASLAIAFAAIASKRTRTPMTTALNAAASALTAMQQGQKEKADQSYKEWEESTRIAMETANYEQRAYQDIMTNITRREELAMSEGKILDDRAYKEAEMQFKVMTQTLNDPEMANMYHQGMMEGGPTRAVQLAAGLAKQREESAKKLKEAALPIVQGKLMQDAVTEMQNSDEWKNGDSHARLQMIYDLEGKMKPSGGRTGVQFNEQQIDLVAEAMVKGRQGPPSPAQLFGRYASPSAVAVMDKARELDPNYDPADWPTYLKARALLQGKDGDTIRAFTVVTHHLAFLDKLKDELRAQGVNDFGSQAANKIATSVAGQFGMPEVTNYQFAQQIVADEIVKAILGTSAGSMTERTSMGSELGKEKTPEQIEGIIGTAKTLASGQLTGQLSKYRHFIEKKWLSPDDVIPTRTLSQLGVKPIDQDKLIEHGLPKEGDDIQLQDVGVTIPNPNPSGGVGKKGVTVEDGSKNPHMVRSKEEFDNAPVGSWVTDPQGNVSQKLK